MDALYEKILNSGHSFNGKLPKCLMSNSGEFALNDGGGWTDGFYIGIFNIAYLLTGNEEFKKIADSYRPFLERRIANTDEINEQYNYLKLDHDVGFIFLPTTGFNYKLNPNENDKQILIKAADVLIERYNEKGKFIRAWDTWKWDTDEQFIKEKKGKAIIDSMMNIPLLFQIAEITGNSNYREVAVNHARTLAKYIVRDDGSTFHSFNFKHETGEPICGRTVQGYSDDSCWSRGQAWAVYGFSLAYKYMRDENILNVADKCTEYFINNLDSVDMPCWDFKAKDEPFAPWDASAACICASGLLELYEITKDSKYNNYAERLIKSIEKFALTTNYPKCQPLILHSTVGSAYRENDKNTLLNKTIGQAVVYADYFYMECLMKQKTDFRIF